MHYHTIKISSFVKSPQHVVWNKISCIGGVNEEFYPILRMTSPDLNMRLSSELVTGKPLFRSWLLLFGLIPFEYDHIQIDMCEDGCGFSERSSMLLMSEWNHTRTLTTTCRGTCVTDTISFRPRLSWMGLFLYRIVSWLFFYRHYRLGVIFGSSVSSNEVASLLDSVVLQ